MLTLSFHFKRFGFISTILLFPLSYLPDFSLIEETFSKLKTLLRRAGARIHEDLQDAIAAALGLITAQDALGWLTHRGYSLPALDERDQELCTLL
jgi:hypothetical protein